MLLGCFVFFSLFAYSHATSLLFTQGLQMDSIQTRVLKSTYGVEIYPEWKSTDPTTRKTNDGRIYKFYRLATRGTEVKVDQQFGYTAYPVFPTQTGMKFDIYTTSETDATFCDERGMSSFGTLEIGMEIKTGIAEEIELNFRRFKVSRRKQTIQTRMHKLEQLLTCQL